MDKLARIQTTICWSTSEAEFLKMTECLKMFENKNEDRGGYEEHREWNQKSTSSKE
jgi:hypothetical protein